MGMTEKDCIFCKIVAGEVPAHKVYEDDSVLAFLDLHPLNPGHALVIPKQHTEEFQDMGGPLFEHVMLVVQVVTRAIKKATNPKRVGLMVLGFDVSHAHVHVVPLNERNDMSSERMEAAQTSEPNHDELAKIAKQLADNT